MTEDYNPTDNAIAERINGIIKTELVYQLRLMEDVTQARECIGRYIDFYNDRRPHMSIDYKTPAAAHLQTGELNKKWKKKKYPKKRKMMRKINYICKTEQQVRVKAYASNSE